MARSSVIVLFFLIGNLKAFAQYSNTVSLGAGSFYSRGYHEKIRPFSQLRISYERQLFKHFSVELGFQQWTNWGKGSSLRLHGYEIYSADYHRLMDGSLLAQQPKPEPSPIPVAYQVITEALLVRHGYKMFDVSARYAYMLNKKQQLSGGIGLSYCSGRNTELTGFYVNPFQGYTTTYTHIERVNYWGIVPQICYDYMLVNNKVVVGLDIIARYYKSYSQYDYGLHIGLNF